MHNFIKKLVYAVQILAVMSAGNSVICYGADGHRAIKSAFHSRYNGRENHENRVRRELESIGFSSSSCGSCIDVLIADDLIKPLNIEISELFSPATHKIVVVEEHIFSSIRISFTSYNSSPFFTHLKSIVLLT